jgi:hypothetical protein
MGASEPRIKATLIQLLLWLVAQDYEAIERFTAGVRLSADVMRRAVYQYGHTLVMPPDSVLNQLDVIEVTGSLPKTWSVRVDLWTAEEGRSDVSLECTLIDRPGELADCGGRQCARSLAAKGATGLRNSHLAGGVHPKTGVPFDKAVRAIQKPSCPHRRL